MSAGGSIHSGGEAPRRHATPAPAHHRDGSGRDRRVDRRGPGAGRLCGPAHLPVAEQKADRCRHQAGPDRRAVAAPHLGDADDDPPDTDRRRGLVAAAVRAGHRALVAAAPLPAGHAEGQAGQGAPGGGAEACGGGTADAQRDPRSHRGRRDPAEHADRHARRAAAVVSGIACLGPDRGKTTCLVRREDWLGKPPPFDRDRALAELARRYVGAFGPATDRDFAYWSGLPLRDVRAGLSRSRARSRRSGSGRKRCW